MMRRYMYDAPDQLGAYPPVQLLAFQPDGWLPLSDDCDDIAMTTHRGYVSRTVTDGVVTSIIGDDAAYQAYLDSVPKPDADTVKANRKTAIKDACEAAIVAGFNADVLGRGTLHYTLTTIQQRDMDKLMQAIKDGATSVFWHDDSRVTHEAYLAAQFKALYQTGYAFMIGCKIRSDWLEQYAVDLVDAGDMTTAQTVGWDTVLPDTYQTQADAQISAMLEESNATT